jgi:hypothetical protein
MKSKTSYDLWLNMFLLQSTMRKETDTKDISKLHVLDTVTEGLQIETGKQIEYVGREVKNLVLVRRMKNVIKDQSSETRA